MTVLVIATPKCKARGFLRLFSFSLKGASIARGGYGYIKGRLSHSNLVMIIEGCGNYSTDVTYANLVKLHPGILEVTLLIHVSVLTP